MPIGILGSLAICSVLYVAVAAVMIGLVPYAELGGPAPMAVTIDYAREAARGTALEGLLRMMPVLVKIAILAGLTSTMVVQMLAQPRIFMAMSRDGLLPAWMGRVHPRFGTPHLTTIATGAVVALAGQHRNAVRIRGGVDGRARASPDPSRSTAAVQGALVAAGTVALGDRLADVDAEPSRGDLDQVARVDGNRCRDLFFLQLQAKSAPDSAVASRWIETRLH
jgi:hypothetical protein